METAWKVFRAVVSALLILVVALPAVLYVLLSLGPVQNTICRTTETELSSLLGADVRVEKITIHPFRRVSVRGISVILGADTVATVATVSAGIELAPLITDRQIVVDYALIDGLNLKVTRPEPGAPLNIDPVIRRLRSDKKEEKTKFNLEINTAIVRRSSASYDVLSEPCDSALFCPDHIKVENLALNAFIPEITDEAYHVILDHLSLDERSGLSVKKLTGDFTFNPTLLSIRNFALDLPQSHIAFEPVTVDFESPATFIGDLRKRGTIIKTSEGNVVYPPDIASFVPVAGRIDRHIGFEIEAYASPDSISLRRLAINDNDDEAFSAFLCANVSDFMHADSMRYEIKESRVTVNGARTAPMLQSAFPSAPSDRLRRFQSLNLLMNGSGTVTAGKLDLTSIGTAGKLTAKIDYNRKGSWLTSKASVLLSEFELGLITGDARLGMVDASAEGRVTLVGKSLETANADSHIRRFDYNGYSFSDIRIAADIDKESKTEISVSVDDPGAKLHLYGFYNAGDAPSLEATATFNRIDLAGIKLTDSHEGMLLSGTVLADVRDFDPTNLRASLRINDLAWTDTSGKGIRLNRITAGATGNSFENRITLEAPFLSGELRGHYNLKTLVPEIKAMTAHFLPALGWEAAEASDNRDGSNNFIFDIELKPSTELTDFLHLPVGIIYDGSVSGRINSIQGYACVDASIPYLCQGTKVIEGTQLFAELDITGDRSLVYATTQMPTKKGDMNVSAAITAANDKVDTRIEWGLDRRIPVNGTMGISAKLNRLVRDGNGIFPVDASIEFLPGTLTFGDDTWAIERSNIEIKPEQVTVRGFALDTGRQRIEINGTAGNDPEDILSVKLRDIRLIHIFETLEINKVLLDGRATGNLSAKSLFNGEPIIECSKLHVDSIGYNRCYMGDADVTARWDTEKRSIYLDGDIKGFNGKDSRVYGDIYPLSESLDLNFKADHVPVGFLKPFMSAFTSDISGHATGECRLYGTFHDIDLTGKVKADDVRLKLDFTNVYYSATDSIVIEPGRINLDNISIHDPEGNTALLNGFVDHTYFRDPVFKFDITDANNFLCYNTTKHNNPDWYGTIYGNGTASVTGRPGVVNINVDMTTAPRSKFSFVLSDRLDAESFSFLTFRDVTPDSLRQKVVDKDPTPLIIREMKEKLRNMEEESTSDYNMDIQIAATPDALMNLVVDPVSGDEINAHGSGGIHISYLSANNDLNIWGKYTVADGKYKFTLQDIIIKEFTIKQGSEITFNGDPYAVSTKLSAYFATNANLADLDESFHQDREVARTNVPVHAVMNVSGDIRQPSLDFDFEFPTLTSDTYRKVKSIVSTPDMMNRQIIYLLAINRFYTPEYMSSADKAKGSELVSVASSTISSQLGNMLGKLSDNWSIAPNLRSDRGDFSDVEVNVALSSRLLNNRLIFNGNFGYRDKALNNDQFIGDFDIEYLLNKAGTWRLKAYNRYNDRNYYVRSALTTQGVGILTRRDFDTFPLLFKGFIKRKKKNTAVKTDVPEQKQE